MAQLYKMTLYVCDLEENLSLGEIETLIDERALNGCAINCICHFTDEKIGKRIDFDDSLDINRIDCHTSSWENYFPEEEKVKNEKYKELIEKLKKVVNGLKEDNAPKCAFVCDDAIIAIETLLSERMAMLSDLANWSSCCLCAHSASNNGSDGAERCKFAEDCDNPRFKHWQWRGPRSAD